MTARRFLTGMIAWALLGTAATIARAAEHSAQDAPPDQVTGMWLGPPCDHRAYHRQLALHEDGTYSATDLVSPCPANVQCIWSGIVNRSGSWRLRGRMVELTTTRHDSRAQPLPGALFYFADRQVLEEAMPGAPVRCEYHRNGPAGGAGPATLPTEQDDFAVPTAARTEVVSFPADIRAHAIRAHVQFLADDALLGRKTGSREYLIAANYVESQFRQVGLAPAGTNGYRQNVPYISATLDPTGLVVRLDGPQGLQDLVAKKFLRR